MATNKSDKLLMKVMPRYNKNNKNDLRNYTSVPHSVFKKLYKQLNTEDEVRFKIIENGDEVKYYVLSKLLKEKKK